VGVPDDDQRYTNVDRWRHGTVTHAPETPMAESAMAEKIATCVGRIAV
jgi:hypothetical protein